MTINVSDMTTTNGSPVGEDLVLATTETETEIIVCWTNEDFIRVSPTMVTTMDRRIPKVICNHTSKERGSLGLWGEEEGAEAAVKGGGIRTGEVNRIEITGGTTTAGRLHLTLSSRFILWIVFLCCACGSCSYFR
uniref:Uncharacterized protein n=1 Tax=Timema tahoe TaxID=61484 RepID=A0A7R9IKR3_9NEOP|nr:unnamed protein product [Timema tahoe]